MSQSTLNKRQTAKMAELTHVAAKLGSSGPTCARVVSVAAEKRDATLFAAVLVEANRIRSHRDGALSLLCVPHYARESILRAFHNSVDGVPAGTRKKVEKAPAKAAAAVPFNDGKGDGWQARAVRRAAGKRSGRGVDWMAAESEAAIPDARKAALATIAEKLTAADLAVLASLVK